MTSYLRKTLHYIGESIEELILLGIIVLNILDFFEMLSPDWDYIKKIVSWTALGYLLYRASLTKLFFGVKSKVSDFLLIISYFFLSFKNVLTISMNSIGEFNNKGAGYWANLHPISGSEVGASAKVVNITSTLQNVDLSTISNLPVGNAIDNLTRTLTLIPGFPLKANEIYLRVSNDLGSTMFFLEPKYLIHRWHNLLVDNWFFLQKYALITGFVMLIVLTFYFVLKFKITSPSVMHIIEEEGDPPRSLMKFILRFLVIFLVLNFFYISVFNLTMEWLGFAVDAPLIIIGVFFYLLIWLKHHKRFKTESIIYRIGNFGEIFYEKFINLFYSKKGLMLGLSGMLVLHLLTDIGNFILPYLIGIHDPLYFHELGSNHEPILSLGILFSLGAKGLYYSDISQLSGFWNLANITFLYIFNVIAILLIFIAPAFIWYIIFKDKKIEIPNYIIAFFYSSLFCFLVVPAFKIGRINSYRLVGVDISTQSILNTAMYPLSAVVFVSIAIGIIAFILTFNEKIKPKVIYGALIIAFYYFGKYIYYFFIDTSSYYVNIVVENINLNEYFLGSYLFVFFALTIIFYVGGFFAYLYEAYKN